MYQFNYLFVMLLVFKLPRYGQSGFFDYTDFEDPLQLLWNARDQVSKEQNSPCSGSIGNMPYEGVCKSRGQCQLTGGMAAGSCGLLSTCCICKLAFPKFDLISFLPDRALLCIYKVSFPGDMGSCGNKFSTKISYFSNLAISGRQHCIYEVQLHNRNICQLRLDFLNMVLAPPAQTGPNVGTCRDEKFFVEGFPNIPRICGKNTGQHMYIPVNGNNTTPIKLHVDLLQEATINRAWTIRITQLQCPGTTVFPYRTQVTATARDFALLAPQNCLQYYTDFKGSFKSFGFDLLNPDTSAYNVNQSYAICFKRYDGVCGISYIPDYFRVGKEDAGGNGQEDFLYVPALQITDVLRDERVSGPQNINNIFTSVTPGPFYVYFRSDSNPDIGNNVGFYIRYELSTSCP